LSISDSDLHQKLINIFVKSNSGRFAEITAAIFAGDIKLAHRLAHTLKSNAGQLGKTALQIAAGNVERDLANGENLVDRNQMEVLGRELDAVLTELTPLVHEVSKESVSPEQFDKIIEFVFSGDLEELLECNDVESLTYIDRLRLLPNSEELVRLIEDMEFRDARDALIELEKNWM